MLNRIADGDPDNGFEKVCVVIPAFNCEDTIARAVHSALAQSEAAEVIVVDDASADLTVQMALSADDGSGRLKVIPLSANGGPARARNVAIEHSVSPIIALLDSDDIFLAGRLAWLLGSDDWDLIADNVAFVRGDPEHAGSFPPDSKTRMLSIEDFIAGSIPRFGRPGAELAFLKPLMRREFLTKHAIRYNDDVRLGEDYLLYLQALAHGARFKLSRRCGYVAVSRSNSTSASFRTTSIEALVRGADEILGSGILTGKPRLLAERQRQYQARRAAHRKFLDTKKAHGLRAALRGVENPSQLFWIGAQVLVDKSKFSSLMVKILKNKNDRRLLLPETLFQ
jgi:succinoglycan biosynthesis protein ExoU